MKNLPLIHRIIAFFTEKHSHLTWAFSIFFILLFVALSIFVAQKEPMLFDIKISEELQEDQSRILNAAMMAISWLGNLWVAGILVFTIYLLFLLSGYRREAVFMLSTLLSGGVTYILKIIVDRPRPSQDLISVLEQAHYQSFPSGHVLFYTVFFGSLFIIAVTSKVLSITTKFFVSAFCITLVVLGAVSRVYLGAHWFSDVVAGFLVGALFVVVSGTVYIRAKRKSSLLA